MFKTVTMRKFIPVINYLTRRNVSNRFIDILPEVAHALKNNLPVVALESTIITHGMPYPKNFETALEVQDIVRNEGAVPATIAIVEGKVKVGLENNALLSLAKLDNSTIKTSRRDFPYVLSKGLSGGTTVAGTIIVAKHVGIQVFVTGGIGGVHRGGESTMDISADLTELGRNSIMVVSSGVKSILDIQRTMEYLETQGVTVATYGPNLDFPTFYTSQSGIRAPYNVTSNEEAAKLLYCSMEMNLNSGILLGVPIPKEFDLGGELINRAIKSAVEAATIKGVSGKDVTPFILEELRKLTGGKSLQSNIGLVKNNAQTGARIAVELTKLLSEGRSGTRVCYRDIKGSLETNLNSVVVIGGSNFDCMSKLEDEGLQTDGRTHPVETHTSGGGVGRNIADALGKLGAPTLLVSALGDDGYGRQLLASLQHHVNISGVTTLQDERTSSYTAVLNNKGECLFGLGDMKIHQTITKQQICRFADKLEKSSLVIIDANIPSASMDYIFKLCQHHNIPVWFEPTNVQDSVKIFLTDSWGMLSFISPNFNELKMIAQKAGVGVNDDLTLGASEEESVVKEAAKISKELSSYFNVVIVTLGKLGVMITRNGSADDPLYVEGKFDEGKLSLGVSSRLYPGQCVSKFVNVVGAGDCFVGGFASRMVRGEAEAVCMAAGLECASLALGALTAVPESFPLQSPHLYSSYRSL